MITPYPVILFSVGLPFLTYSIVPSRHLPGPGCTLMLFRFQDVPTLYVVCKN